MVLSSLIFFFFFILFFFFFLILLVPFTLPPLLRVACNVEEKESMSGRTRRNKLNNKKRGMEMEGVREGAGTVQDK